MKKVLLTTAIILALAVYAYPQKIIDKSIKVDGQKTELKFDFADDIKLEAWNKNSIELQVSVDIDENTYNDYYSLEVRNEKNKIEVVEDIDFDGIKKLRGNDKFCNFEMNIHYTLKVPEDLNFSLKTISGEIELLGCLGEMDINTVSGYIDYSVPPSHSASIDLSTVTGDVYSNLNFEQEESDEISWVGTNRQLSLNNGHTEVDLKTVSGDIYLRKY